MERAPRRSAKAGRQLLLIRVCGETQVTQLQGCMFKHQREKLQGRDLRVRQQLCIGPIKRLFNMVWSYLEAYLGVETGEKRVSQCTPGASKVPPKSKSKVSRCWTSICIPAALRLSNSVP